jgi:hypothetical protein
VEMSQSTGADGIGISHNTGRINRGRFNASAHRHSCSTNGERFAETLVAAAEIQRLYSDGKVFEGYDIKPRGL